MPAQGPASAAILRQPAALVLPDIVARIQAIADKNIETYGLLDDEAKQAIPEGIDE